MFSFLSKFPFVSGLIAKLFPNINSSENTSALQTHREATSVATNEQQTNSERLNGELDSELQREIRKGRKFSLAEAIGREGGSFMKGESAVPRPVRANNAIKQFLDSQLIDTSSAFATTLFTWAKADIRVSRQLDTPLVALAQILESLLSEPTTFYEFYRQVAIAQATITGDRPHFQQPGEPPHPEADYSHKLIRTQLLELLEHIP
ncbi:MAG: hypothetical protein ACFB0D_22755 [Phormidesmis sp.]|mgnify:FL=1